MNNDKLTIEQLTLLDPSDWIGDLLVSEIEAVKAMRRQYGM